MEMFHDSLSHELSQPITTTEHTININRQIIISLVPRRAGSTGMMHLRYLNLAPHQLQHHQTTSGKPPRKPCTTTFTTSF